MPEIGDTMLVAANTWDINTKGNNMSKNIFLIISFDNKNWSEYFHGLMKIIPEQRHTLAMQYKRLIDRQNCCFVYCLLEFGLQKFYDLKVIPEIRKDERGKPKLAAADELYFNWSHCDGGIGCAIATKEIGCDVQSVISDSEILWDRCLHDNEKKAAPYENRDAFFTKMWTLKESYLKYTGEGLYRDMRTIDFSKCSGSSGRAAFEKVNLTWGTLGNTYYSVSSEGMVCVKQVRLEEIYDFLCGKDGRKGND